VFYISHVLRAVSEGRGAFCGRQDVSRDTMFEVSAANMCERGGARAEHRQRHSGDSAGRHASARRARPAVARVQEALSVSSEKGDMARVSIV